MSELRIFSNLPSPRIWKATIAARICGVGVDAPALAHFRRLRSHAAFAPDVEPYLSKIEGARAEVPG